MAIGAEIGAVSGFGRFCAQSPSTWQHMRSTSRASTALIQALVLSGQEVRERQNSQSMRTRTTRSRLFQGSHSPGKSSALVTVTQGQPTADAICAGPLSLPTNSRHRLSRAASWVKDVLPVMSRQRVPNAARSMAPIG